MKVNEMFCTRKQNVMNENIESMVVVCKLVCLLPCVFAEEYTVNHLVEEV